MGLCSVAYYFSASLDFHLEQIYIIYSDSRPIHLLLSWFLIYMASNHAELDAMEQ